MVQLAIIQIALPLLSAAWLILGRPPSRADLWLRIGAAWLLLAGVALAGIWLAVPRISVLVLGALLLAASVTALVRRRTKRSVEQRFAGWPGRLLAVVLAAFGIWATVPALAGWHRPANAFELVFPFREGHYLVANGGFSARVNAHFMTLEPRFANLRGQSYAVDLIRVDQSGFRTREQGLFRLPPAPSAYLTFGTPVSAPCAGRVEATEERRADMPVPQRDRRNLEGNFVRLRCGGHDVFLAHFRKQGVLVAAGDRVGIGQVLGYVGNSGNTDEPHLHVHVQSPGSAAAPLSGAPIALTFDGRFPVRNMIFEAGAKR